MAATKYTYSVSGDTADGKVAPDSLANEIQASSIVTALDYISVNGDVLDIWFKDALSGGDETTLTAVVAAHTGVPLPQGTQDINIKTVESGLELPEKQVGFRDLTGHNFYKPGEYRYEVTAGEEHIFMEKFASNIYLAGGGYCIPASIYQSNSEVVQKPEDGDYVCFDMVDVDNVLGYGNSKTISKVARSSNVATITTTADHGYSVDDVVCIDADDATFDDMEVAIASVPTSTTFTYANTGDDVAEKDDSGSVGLIVVLAPFVPKDMTWPGKLWQVLTEDAKLVPAGIYLRFRAVSTGDTNDYIVYVWYNMRTA
jgi:hypothetical protein